jgi:hypothetical protein
MGRSGLMQSSLELQDSSVSNFASLSYPLTVGPSPLSLKFADLPTRPMTIAFAHLFESSPSWAPSRLTVSLCRPPFPMSMYGSTIQQFSPSCIGAGTTEHEEGRRLHSVTAGLFKVEMVAKRWRVFIMKQLESGSK